MSKTPRKLTTRNWKEVRENHAVCESWGLTPADTVDDELAECFQNEFATGEFFRAIRISPLVLGWRVVGKFAFYEAFTTREDDSRISAHPLRYSSAC